MTDELILDLAPDHECVEFALSSKDCSIKIEEPKASILLAVAPSLVITEPDNTDYTLYYNLSKG